MNLFADMMNQVNQATGFGNVSQEAMLGALHPNQPSTIPTEYIEEIKTYQGKPNSREQFIQEIMEYDSTLTYEQAAAQYDTLNQEAPDADVPRTNVVNEETQATTPMRVEPVITEETAPDPIPVEVKETILTNPDSHRVTSDGQLHSVEEEGFEMPSWWRMGKGLAQGLNAYGMALLTTGDEGKAWASGIQQAFAPLREDQLKASNQLKRNEQAIKFAEQGKYTPASIEQWKLSGNESDLVPQMSAAQQYSIATQQAKTAKETQAKQLENKQAYDSAIDNINQGLRITGSLLAGDALEKSAGLNSYLPTIRGSESSDFQADLETLKSQAFLSAIQSMKGMGALSNDEGKKLEAAMANLSVEQSDAQLRENIEYIQTIFLAGKQRAEELYRSQGGTVQQPTKPTTQTSNYSGLWK